MLAPVRMDASTDEGVRKFLNDLPLLIGQLDLPSMLFPLSVLWKYQRPCLPVAGDFDAITLFLPRPEIGKSTVKSQPRKHSGSKACVGQLRRMDEGIGRRGAHEGCIFRFSHRRTDCPHAGPVDICVLHDPWMVVIRRKSGRIPPRPKGHYSLPLDMGCCSDDRLDPFAPDRLVACRCYKRSHGDSKPGFIDCAEWRHRFRNTPLSMEQQLRCRGTHVPGVSHY